MAAYIADSEYTRNIISILNAARLAQTPVLLWGSPGTGKTALIHALAERNQIPLRILLGSIMDPTDLSGLPALQMRQGATGSYQVAENTRPDWADDLIQQGQGILFLDELTNATPTIQSALLSLLQGRTVGQHTLPDDVWILAAANEPEDATDGHDLAAPMANRVLHINWNPPVADWLQGMLVSWGEENTSDEVRNQRITFAAFLRTYPNLIQDQPKDESDAGKAWASRRSWDNAAKVLGALEKEGKVDNGVRRLVLNGLVGEVASNSFFSWEKQLSLPSHEQVIKDPSAIKWKELKADAILTIVDRTLGLMTKETANSGIEVLAALVDAGHKDIAAGSVRDMLARSKQVGGSFDPKSDAMKKLVQVAATAKLS